jgi:carbon starvation protein
MQIVMLIVAAAAVLILGGLLYSRMISRVLGEDLHRPTPAVSLNDGVDYVPTPTPVVFAHHFASIAGAGPIVGPIFALAYGWGPALAWVVLGGILAGGVHDYVAMFISMRERGKSIAVIAREALGRTAFLCFVALLIVLLVLVCAQFLKLSATALTSKMPPAALSMEPGQTLFRTVVEVDPVTKQEVTLAVIGGIASTSVIVITLLAPLIGFLYIKRQVPVWICSLLSIVICGLSIWAGFLFPVSISNPVWMSLICMYCVLAAGFPVWMFLQSRDFINVHLLYIGLVMLAVAVLLAGFNGAVPSMKMIDFAGGYASAQAPLWPFLFITVSCGALSGFHSLCATGTTPKQLTSERAARTVGYWGMLLESFLAVCVIAACLVALSQAKYQEIVYPGGGKAGNPVLAFAFATGHICHQAFEPLLLPLGIKFPVAFGTVFGMLLLEGFIITTLDTAVRLTRYLLEELWATLFSDVDVFAEAANREAARAAGPAGPRRETPALQASGDLNPAGGAGLDVHPQIPHARRSGKLLVTSGLTRGVYRVLQNYWFNSAGVVVLMLALALSPASAALWPIFGSGNQLLAALALLVVSAWLAKAGRPVWYTAVPCVFIMVTTLTMLVTLLVRDYIPHWQTKWPLLCFDIVILVLTAMILGSAARAGLGVRGRQAATVPGVEPVP